MGAATSSPATDSFASKESTAAKARSVRLVEPKALDLEALYLHESLPLPLSEGPLRDRPLSRQLKEELPQQDPHSEQDKQQNTKINLMNWLAEVLPEDCKIKCCIIIWNLPLNTKLKLNCI